MIEAIRVILKSIWFEIVRILIKILNFFKNIISWFKDESRLKKIKEDRNLVAVSIKDKLSNGDYSVVNCLYDKDENEIIDSQVIEAGQLDDETINRFGSKEMIILK